MYIFQSNPQTHFNSINVIPADETDHSSELRTQTYSLSVLILHLSFTYSFILSSFSIGLRFFLIDSLTLCLRHNVHGSVNTVLVISVCVPKINYKTVLSLFRFTLFFFFFVC